MPTCPVCGAEAVRIVYGMPGPQLIEDLREGRIALGGCVVGEDMPKWACKGPVQHRFSEGPVEATP